MWQNGIMDLCILFCNGTAPIHEGSILMTYHFPKALPPNSITLRVRISAYGIGMGGQLNIKTQTIAVGGEQIRWLIIVMEGRVRIWNDKNLTETTVLCFTSLGKKWGMSQVEIWGKTVPAMWKCSWKVRRKVVKPVGLGKSFGQVKW